MVEIAVFLQKNKFSGFEVKGHSGYAEHGEDIVCSAISAITQTAVIGLQNYLGKISLNIKDGFLKCCFCIDKLSEVNMKESQIIIETMILGLKSIEESYGNYINIVIKEVND